MGIHLSPNDIKRIGRFAIALAIFGIIQFLFMIFLAIIFYPGGYNFFGYFLSDLGAVRSRNGELNTLPSLLFSIAFSLLGLSLVPFWLLIPLLFATSKYEKIFGVLGSIMGLLTTPLIIGVVVYPMDTQLDTHEFYAWSYAFFLALAIFFYSLTILRNLEYPNSIKVISFALFIILGIFEIFNFGNLQPLIQKIVFTGFILWMLIQVSQVWSLTNPKTSSPP